MSPKEHFNTIDDRSAEIFRSIVDSYLSTGEPVGSRNVSRMLQAALSPASVRNVMADLEAMGLIYAPHASAGRMPTEQGLRFFVDAFLEVGDLSQAERQEIEARVGRRDKPQPMDELLAEASHMLSGLSRGAGVVLSGKQNKRLKHIEFVRIEPCKALMILVADDGAVENRLIDIPEDLPPSVLTEASNYLSGNANGRRLDEIKSHLERMQNERRKELSELADRLVQGGLAVWSGGDGNPATLIVRGRSNLLDDKSVLDIERIKLLFDDLETRRDIIELLSAADEGEGVRIFIGSENKLFSLSGSSLIVAPFRGTDDHVVGVLGVIGPTRFDYGRVVPMVDYTARLVTQLIGRSG